MTNVSSSLAGRRILLTRSEEDCAAWAVEFERRGARPVLLPCIHTEALDSPELRRSLEEALATADWLAFTSRRGVEAFAELRAGTTPLVPSRCRVAVVGAATAAVARERLGRADLVGRDGTAAGLGATLIADGELAARPHVVFAVAANAATVPRQLLGAVGARCTRIDVYRTVPAREVTRKRALSSLQADNVVLASPSAATGFVHQVDVDVAIAIYTIGPSTTKAARELGLQVTAEAPQPSLEGLLEAMQWQS
jgi:uroporphyrinogen-III synthase